MAEVAAARAATHLHPATQQLFLVGDTAVGRAPERGPPRARVVLGRRVEQLGTARRAEVVAVALLIVEGRREGGLGRAQLHDGEPKRRRIAGAKLKRKLEERVRDQDRAARKGEPRHRVERRAVLEPVAYHRVLRQVFEADDDDRTVCCRVDLRIDGQRLLLLVVVRHPLLHPLQRRLCFLLAPVVGHACSGGARRRVVELL
eukprot:5190847-Prymnesium_polylepis.1